MANYNDDEDYFQESNVVELPSHPGFISGYEYTFDSVVSTTSSASTNFTDNIAFVFFEFTGQSLEKFIVETLTGSTTFGDLQIGVYTIIDGYPSQKLFSVSENVGGSGFHDLQVNQIVPEGWHAIGFTINQLMNFTSSQSTVAQFGLNYYGLFPGSTALPGGIKFSFDSNQTLPNIFDKNNYTQSVCTDVPVIRLVFN